MVSNQTEYVRFFKLTREIRETLSISGHGSDYFNYSNARSKLASHPIKSIYLERFDILISWYHQVLSRKFLKASAKNRRIGVRRHSVTILLEEMAKWGEGDPRWIVEERPDGTNVNNWHW